MQISLETSDTYKTIVSPSEGQYKEKGSKFFAFAYPVYSIEEIKEHIERINKEYYDARHRCYAWKLGLSDENYRQNDDGEPSGTAGKPIYGQLLSHSLTNIIVIVVRYFGGIKLGTSGLINAYKTATADAIQNATIVERTVNVYYMVNFAYEAMNDVMRVMKEEQTQILAQDFNLMCRLRIFIRQSRVQHLISELEKIETVSFEYEKTL